MSRVSVKPGTGPEHPTTPRNTSGTPPGHPQAPPEQHLTGWIPGTPLITKIRPKNKQKIINESKNIMILVLFSLILIFCL